MSSHEGGPIETPGDIRAGKAVKGTGEGVVDLVDHNWDTRQRACWRDCMQGGVAGGVLGVLPEAEYSHHTPTRPHTHTHTCMYILRTS